MKRSFLLGMLLLVAGLQTAWGQYGMRVWHNGSHNQYYLSDVDSVQCSDNINVWHDNVYDAYNVGSVDSVEFVTLSFLSCPDSHHPHAIDLGLPSGTKWCCCNVGASSPVEKGGLYAWGETIEKEVYNAYTYVYCYAKTEYIADYIYIGDNIAGTLYDAARVRMGAPWRMPSLEQIEELINNCSRKWIWDWETGVGGIYVTGPNGAQIFLHYSFPASGGGAACGSYWSSSYNPSRPHAGCIAYAMQFINNSRTTWAIESAMRRESGLSVRAVCP